MRFGVARTQGKNLLRQRHDAAFRRHYGADLNEVALEAAIDELLTGVLDVLAKSDRS